MKSPKENVDRDDNHAVPLSPPLPNDSLSQDASFEQTELPRHGWVGPRTPPGSPPSSSESLDSDDDVSSRPKIHVHTIVWRDPAHISPPPLPRNADDVDQGISRDDGNGNNSANWRKNADVKY